MNIRYTIEQLEAKRADAGLGVLSLGLYGNGDLVSSTPIPGSHIGGPDPDPEYGGYLLGEGMTREAALYLGTLHNLFPALAEAARTNEAAENDDLLARAEAAEAELARVREAYGLGPDVDLVAEFDRRGEEAEAREKELEAERKRLVAANEALDRRVDIEEAQDRLAAIDAAREGEPPMPSKNVLTWINWATGMEAWGRQGWDAAAALRVALAEVTARLDTASATAAGDVAQAREEGAAAERERIAAMLDQDAPNRLALVTWDRAFRADEDERDLYGDGLRAALAPVPAEEVPNGRA